MTGLTIGEKHTYKDFNIKLLEFHVSPAKPITKEVEIPGMNGPLDLSECFGEVFYNARSLVAEFDMEEPGSKEFETHFEEIRNYMNGLVHKIIPDFDDEFFYEGRINLSYSKKNNIFYGITISADVYPYKLKNEKTVVSATVSGTKEINCSNLRKSVVPTITTTADFTIEFNGNSYAISSGENIIVPDIKFVAGDNVLKCSGTGTITFTYQEGSL